MPANSSSSGGAAGLRHPVALARRETLLGLAVGRLGAGMLVREISGTLCGRLPPLEGRAVMLELGGVAQLKLERRRNDELPAFRALLDAVAPGWTLLVVGHWFLDPEHARRHGFDLADYLQPDDVKARLGEEWTVETDETRPRVHIPHARSPHTPDAVLRARRSS